MPENHAKGLPLSRSQEELLVTGEPAASHGNRASLAAEGGIR